MKARIVTAAVALVFGAVGMVLAVVGAHCWEDHKALHVLIQIESARQQALQQATPPAKPPQ